MFQRFELQLAYLRRFMCAVAIVAVGNSSTKALDDLPPAVQRDVTSVSYTHLTLPTKA